MPMTLVDRRPWSVILRDGNRCRKVITRNCPEPGDPVREREILRRLRDLKSPDTIVALCEDGKNDRGDITLDIAWIPGHLVEHARNLSIDRRVTLLCDLAHALQWLHAHDVIHRDVNPSNVLVNAEGRAVLIDFGIAWAPWASGSETSQTLCPTIGTGMYRAPETLFGCTAYTSAVDIWCFGLVAATVLDSECRPLFEVDDGTSELSVIAACFKTLGTPASQTMAEWRGGSPGMGVIPSIREDSPDLVPALQCGRPSNGF
ncbi:hypothetical protein PYCC9005_003223 [Savitreella phatthalungensis]